MRIRHRFRQLEPRVLAGLNGPLTHRFRPWLDRHDLLSFQRHPLALGVAIGMFCGIVPGPFQVVATVLLCAWWRGNAIAGVLATFYTNPLTIVPLWALAFHIGQGVLPGKRAMPPWPTLDLTQPQFMSQISEWALSLGTPLLVGLPVMGLAFAGLAWLAVHALWLGPVYRRWWSMRRHLARPTATAR